MRNLFSKDDWRQALTDEVTPGWPQVPGVLEATPSTGAAERLTRARTGPNGNDLGPAGESEDVTPDPNAGEGVELPGVSDVVGDEIGDSCLKNFSWRDQVQHDQVAEPLRHEWVEFIVDDEHLAVDYHGSVAGFFYKQFVFRSGH